MTPCLVHFPDRDPRIVMCLGDSMPRPGEMLLSGWIVDRHAIVVEAKADYDVEVWVKPIAA